MANADHSDKHRVKSAAAIELTPQTTCPMPVGAPLGFWSDSTAANKVKRRDPSGRDTGVMSAEGVIPSARLNLATNPTDADTVTIGTKTFTFKASLVAATTTTQVKILGSAALTMAAFLDAINGVANANVVLDTTPFTLSIVADAVTATKVRIQKASKQGGTPIAGTVASTPLSRTLTAGADIWSAADLNVTGKVATDSRFTAGQFAITAAMITNGSYQVELPFTPTCFQLFVTASTGVQRASTDAVTISGNALSIALGGGASPAIQATDIVRFWAIE
jgi:hypothetical protein